MGAGPWATLWWNRGVGNQGKPTQKAANAGPRVFVVKKVTQSIQSYAVLLSKGIYPSFTIAE